MERLATIIFAATVGTVCCGGPQFKLVETAWTASDATTTRLTRGATTLGCSVSKPDQSGEMVIDCPEQALGSQRDAGKIRIGPSVHDQRMLAMCEDGLSRDCPTVLKRFWKEGAK